MAVTVVVRQQPIIDGVPGDTGPTGATGPAGADGAAGPPGPPGAGIEEVTAAELLAFTSETVDLSAIYRATSSSGNIVVNQLYHWDVTDDALHQLITVPIGPQTEFDLGASDWDDRNLTAGDFSAGVAYYFRAQDIAAKPGPMFAWDATNEFWRVTAPVAVVFDAAQTDGVASASPQMIKPILIKAGLLRAARYFDIHTGLFRNNATDNVSTAVNTLGAAGTTADTALAGFTSSAAITGTDRTRGMVHRYAVINATTLRHMGSGNQAGNLTGSSATVGNASFTVANMDTTDLYVGTVVQMAATATIPSVQCLIVILYP